MHLQLLIVYSIIVRLINNRFIIELQGPALSGLYYCYSTLKSEVISMLEENSKIMPADFTGCKGGVCMINAFLIFVIIVALVVDLLS